MHHPSKQDQKNSDDFCASGGMPRQATSHNKASTKMLHFLCLCGGDAAKDGVGENERPRQLQMRRAVARMRRDALPAALDAQVWVFCLGFRVFCLGFRVFLFRV